MFLDALRRHLELARQGLLSTRRFPTWLDDARREARMLEIFEIAEQQAEEGERRHNFWRILGRWGDGQARILVEHLVAQLAEFALLSGQPEADEELIEWAVRKEVIAQGVTESRELRVWSSPVRGLRIQACARRAATAASAEAAVLHTFSVPRYAEELQLVRTVETATALRPAGAMFLDLRGRDAMRWLLALETSAALGNNDPWRISPARAAALVAERPVEVWGGEDRLWPWNFDDLRFVVSGFVGIEVDDGLATYRLTPLGVELFGELDQPSGEALRSLARATLADEAHEALHGRPPAVSEVAELGRHTRMVAHELRNILVPVQLTLKQLRRQGSGEGFVTENAVSLDNIAGGLERALRFATETARVTSQGVSRDELFAAEAAVRDAIMAVQSDLRHPVEFTSSAGVERVYLRGRRERFVLAILNLLRNASQAGGAEVRIFVRAEVTAGAGPRLVVVVEDDGPGVPLEQQAAIFADGVSFRVGGSGHGLALVRGVVEDDLRGSIHYEPGTRGGARFVLRLPIPLEGVT